VDKLRFFGGAGEEAALGERRLRARNSWAGIMGWGDFKKEGFFGRKELPGC
jgi:hypothetical protein